MMHRAQQTECGVEKRYSRIWMGTSDLTKLRNNSGALYHIPADDLVHARKASCTVSIAPRPMTHKMGDPAYTSSMFGRAST